MFFIQIADLDPLLTDLDPPLIPTAFAGLFLLPDHLV
jgi:hypothetical protein